MLRILCLQGLVSLMLLIYLSAAGAAQTRLMVIGGGQRPAAALQLFGKWIGGEQGRLLVVAWAAKADPVATAQAVSDDFRSQYRGRIDISLTPPLDFHSQMAFLDQLDQASGVFFTGGDQRRILDVLGAHPFGETIRKALEEAYESGVPFGGTSAGAAIMSPVMILGQRPNGKILSDRGLGFLAPHQPDGSIHRGVVVDQHFSQRQREERLLSVIQEIDGQTAIGIDEDTAFMLTDRREGEVLGENSVRIFKRSLPGGAFQETQLIQGEKYNFPSHSAARFSYQCSELLVR